MAAQDLLTQLAQDRQKNAALANMANRRLQAAYGGRPVPSTVDYATRAAMMAPEAQKIKAEKMGEAVAKAKEQGIGERDLADFIQSYLKSNYGGDWWMQPEYNVPSTMAERIALDELPKEAPLEGPARDIQSIARVAGFDQPKVPSATIPPSPPRESYPAFRAQPQAAPQMAATTSPVEATAPSEPVVPQEPAPAPTPAPHPFIPGGIKSFTAPVVEEYKPSTPAAAKRAKAYEAGEIGAREQSRRYAAAMAAAQQGKLYHPIEKEEDAYDETKDPQYLEALRKSHETSQILDANDAAAGIVRPTYGYAPTKSEKAFSKKLDEETEKYKKSVAKS
jgi:hypothetical protein